MNRKVWNSVNGVASRFTHFRAFWPKRKKPLSLVRRDGPSNVDLDVFTILTTLRLPAHVAVRREFASRIAPRNGSFASLLDSHFIQNPRFILL